MDRVRLADYCAEATLRDDVSSHTDHGLVTSFIRIWEQAFTLQRIVPTDEFFELGDHLLLAIDILDRIETVHDIRLPLTALCAASTVERLADFAAQRQHKKSSSNRA